MSQSSYIVQVSPLPGKWDKLAHKGNISQIQVQKSNTSNNVVVYATGDAEFVSDMVAQNKPLIQASDGTKYYELSNNASKINITLLLKQESPESDLPDDGRPQPEKGANKDPTTWKPVKMKEDDMWKVVDDNDVNVADQFHSEANAKQYIDFHKLHPITGGGSIVAAGDFNSVIGQGPKLGKKNEHHDPKGWREELGVPQPGPDFQVDYVVEIGADREEDNEEVSIQYDGLEHSGNNDRTGDKILFKINKGQIAYLHQIDTDNSQEFEVGKKEGVEPGKDKFEPLQKGKRYGLRVAKRNGADGKTTEHWGYMQNLTDGGPLKEVIHVIDRGQFKGDNPRVDWNKNWRVGVRIDGKNGEDDPMYTRGFVVKKI